MQASSFFSNPFLEFCFLTQLFLPPYCCTSSCKYLPLWKFQSIALGPKILWKRWFAQAFCKHFSFVMPFSHESEHAKTHDLTDYQLTQAIFPHHLLQLLLVDKTPANTCEDWCTIRSKRWRISYPVFLAWVFYTYCHCLPTLSEICSSFIAVCHQLQVITSSRLLFCVFKFDDFLNWIAKNL